MADHLSDSDVQRIADALAKKIATQPAPVVTADQASAMALAAARTAVTEHESKTWALLGFDIANKRDVERLHKTLSFADSVRQGSTNLASALVKAIAISLVVVALGWLALGAKLSITGAAPPQIAK